MVKEQIKKRSKEAWRDRWANSLLYSQSGIISTTPWFTSQEHLSSPGAPSVFPLNFPLTGRDRLLPIISAS